MKRVKKWIALTLVACMSLVMLAGCGAGNSGGSGNDPTPESTADTSGASADDTAGTQAEADKNIGAVDNSEPYEVAITFITLGTDPVDLPKVEQAMSDYCLEKFNCTIKLKAVPMSNITSQYNLWASSGEKVDLLCLWDQNMGAYINEGKILNLDEYMTAEIIPNILKSSEEWPYLAGGQYDGHQYAIPSVQPSSGAGKAMYGIKSDLDAIDYEVKDIYTYEELLDIFGKLKAAFPDKTPWAQLGTLTKTLSEHFISCDNLGTAGALSGVLMDVGSGSTEVVNLFETEEYYQFLKFMKACYENGYISADAATTSDTVQDWVVSGRSQGFNIQDDTPGNLENTTSTWNQETVQFNIKPTYVTTTVYSQINWGVSASSEKPERALQVLDEWYSEDGTLLNMIMNGLEGEHYVKRENSKIIDYPAGIDATNTPFSNILGLYGDKRYLSMFAPNEDSFYEKSGVYSENALKMQSEALGYTFVSDDYTNELASISAVVSQYMTSLEYGMVEDLDSYYQEFITALKDAGIDRVIAANQEQLDAFLASR